MYTCHEIRTKLNQKGYESEIIEKLISDFVSRKFLNDRQFAESWVENRLLHRPRGPVVLQQELRKKGIDREIINEVLQDIQSTYEQIELAKQALAKKKNYQNEKDSMKKRRKIFQYLAQKGFSPDIIREISRKVLKKSEIETEE